MNTRTSTKHLVRLATATWGALATFVSSALPAAAQQIGALRNGNDVIDRLVSIGNVVIFLLMSFAVVYIVYVTVIYFIKGKDSSEDRREAGMRIFYGILGLFIILSIWGLVNLLLNTFLTNNYVPVNRLPKADVVNGQNYDPRLNGSGFQPYPTSR